MAPSIKFYADEHVARAVIRGLRARGVDVRTARDANMLEAADEAHLQQSASEDRVLFTQDDDFLRLHASGVEHAGLVYTPPHTPIGKIVSGLMLIYQVLTSQKMRNHVEFL